jgi:hypothetical protein
MRRLSLHLPPPPGPHRPRPRLRSPLRRAAMRIRIRPRSRTSSPRSIPTASGSRTRRTVSCGCPTKTWSAKVLLPTSLRATGRSLRTTTGSGSATTRSVGWCFITGAGSGYLGRVGRGFRVGSTHTPGSSGGYPRPRTPMSVGLRPHQPGFGSTALRYRSGSRPPRPTCSAQARMSFRITCTTMSCTTITTCTTLRATRTGTCRIAERRRGRRRPLRRVYPRADCRGSARLLIREQLRRRTLKLRRKCCPALGQRRDPWLGQEHEHRSHLAPLARHRRVLERGSRRHGR